MSLAAFTPVKKSLRYALADFGAKLAFGQVAAVQRLCNGRRNYIKRFQSSFTTQIKAGKDRFQAKMQPLFVKRQQTGRKNRDVFGIDYSKEPIPKSLLYPP